MKRQTVKQISDGVQAVILCVTTVVACILSYLAWESAERSNQINERATISANRVNEQTLELERYRQTIQLCDKVNSIYVKFNSYRTDDMVEFKLWEMGEDFSLNTMSDAGRISRAKSVVSAWKNLDTQSRLERLTKNNALTDLFYCFEDAMMLYRKGLLDAHYFDNYIANIITRLSHATNPTVEQFIDTLCYRANRNDIWLGFRYCRDSIMLEPIIIPRGVLNSHRGSQLYVDDIMVRLNDTVRAGDRIFILRSRDSLYNDGSFTLSAKRNGIVDKVMTAKDKNVREGQIVMELRPI